MNLSVSSILHPFTGRRMIVASAITATQSGPAFGSQIIAPLIGATVDQIESAEPGSNILLLSFYCVCIIVASLVGGWLPTVLRLTHTRLQTMISFVGGLMLGIGVFHMLPHAVSALGNPHAVGNWIMVGIAMTFVLLRLFHFHNHEPVTLTASSKNSSCDHTHNHSVPGHSHAEPDPASAGGADHSAKECHSTGHIHGVSWVGIALGLSLHTLFDGIALGASMQNESGWNGSAKFIGLGTFMAVLLHKPLDAVSISAIMISEGWSRRTVAWVNVGFALMCPIGAALFFLGIQQFPGFRTELVGTTLAFACGVFVCIALSDLLPEMEFHAHNTVQLTIALTSGIALAWLLTLMEATPLS